ncbi:S41 family peptidase [Aminipila luticellarii]|uniref:S41 family peptidase n=1 Tax=Aminipila luticellarii TaxID=2507160 RepID=A0A410PUJ3_9FIRM|nr:S41 family peptidase [Aminipila luticellarii]QAT42595.1 S41 family peptidase [Aminipila luticellarii]
MQIKKRNLVIVIVVAALFGSVVTFAGMNFIPGQSVRISKDDYSAYKTIMSRYAKVEALYETLNKYYYKDLDQDKLIQGMCYGLFEGTGDPYTNYMSKGEYDNLMVKTTGKLEGIGVTVGASSDGYIVVVSTVKDSPAEKAGIKSGDLILAVNDVSYKGSQLDTAVANMRGKVGSKVKVTYLRDGKSVEANLTRASIKLDSVFAETLDHNIGYIYISNFETDTAAEFKKELHGFEVKGVDGVIIDLRNNGGGVVESGIEVADLLLDEGVLAYTEGKSQERTYMKTTAGKTSLPYVLLINGGTASTSEIVAAGIKDNKGGKIVGTKSFGKGVIQSLAPLKEGDAVKITIAQYFSPKGKVIQGIGVEPDYVVELPENSKVDTQLNKAVELLTNDK